MSDPSDVPIGDLAARVLARLDAAGDAEAAGCIRRLQRLLYHDERERAEIRAALELLAGRPPDAAYRARTGQAT
jgi:hypothetical protein